MRRPTRASRVWISTPKPTMGLPHGGGSAMPLFSTMGATHITSRMSLLMSYWPMASVVGATSEHRILLAYGRIPPSIRPYTCEYTAVYSKYSERFVLNLTCCAPVACACAHGSIGQLAHICLAHVSAAIIVSSMFANPHPKEKGLCSESIQDFCEGIKRRQLTPYAVCALHPQTSTPAHYYV